MRDFFRNKEEKMLVKRVVFIGFSFLIIIGACFVSSSAYARLGGLGDPFTGNYIVGADGKVSGDDGVIARQNAVVAAEGSHEPEPAPENPLDETIIKVLKPATSEELNLYREQLEEYRKMYERKPGWINRNYWIGQIDYFTENPISDGFVYAPDRVIEAKLHVMAANEVSADMQAEAGNLSKEERDAIRDKLNSETHLDKNISSTLEEEIRKRCSRMSFSELNKKRNREIEQYNYWTNKTTQDGAFLDDGIFNAYNQIEASRLWVIVSTEIMNDISGQAGQVPALGTPDEIAGELNIPEDRNKNSFNSGVKQGGSSISSIGNISYWYAQLNASLGTIQQTEARQGYARGVLRGLMDKYGIESVSNHLRGVLGIRDDEIQKLIKTIYEEES